MKNLKITFATMVWILGLAMAGGGVNNESIIAQLFLCVAGVALFAAASVWLIEIREEKEEKFVIEFMGFTPLLLSARDYFHAYELAFTDHPEKIIGGVIKASEYPV